MNKPTSQNIPLSDAAQEARKVQHPALLLNANQERCDSPSKGARVAKIIDEIERRYNALSDPDSTFHEMRRELAETKYELEKARDQFMREREHWLALRDDNTRLIRIVDELLKERGKAGNEKDRN